MPVAETTNTFLVEEVIKTKITQKLPEHKCVQVPSTEQLLEDGSVGKAVQYATSIPQMLSLQRLILQSFCYFWVKIESILRTSDLWQKLCCCIGKSFESIRKCVVPENAHTPPTEGIGNSRGWRGGDSQRSCMYVEMYEAYMLLEFLGGWGGGS